MKQIFFLALLAVASSCANNNNDKKSTPKVFDNEGHELVYKMVQKVGDYNALLQKKDVSYTYTYTTPDGKKDVSKEKYIFEGELSMGEYKTHERTMPNLEGKIIQGFDGDKYWLKHNGKSIKDSSMLQRVTFNRPTNFYWFAMLPKLLDPGLSYEHLGKIDRNDQSYDIVKVSFSSSNDKPTDIYQIYINQESKLVDYFLFTVADYGVLEKPFLMELKYTSVDGIKIPANRRYKASNWKAELEDDTPWISVIWSDIKFNTGLQPESFKL